MDADNSGAISRDELMEQVKTLQVRVPPAYVQALLTLADRDRSGEIEFSEFKALLSNLETPDTLARLDAILKRMAGDKVKVPTPSDTGAALDKDWRPVGTRDTWLEIQADCQIVSHEEGLLAYKGRVYQQQDPGGGRVIVVDVESGEIIYWNKFFR